MAYIKLFGDPDTAVNLDRLLRDLHPLVGVIRLGGRTSMFPFKGNRLDPP